MNSIPISQISRVVPGVIAAGGQASRLTGLLLSQDASVPPGGGLDFFDATTMTNWFGPSSPEAVAAANYFPGIVNGGQLPYDLKVVRYAASATPAGSYGATVPNTLSQLQALSGTLIVTTNGTQKTSATINLATATSYSNAAALMTAGFTTPDFAITYDTQRNRFLLLTTATGTAATSTDVSGTLANAVGLSSASGAFIQLTGVAADTPASAMARAVIYSDNWGAFTTAWQATLADRLAFATWNSGQNSQFWYVPYDLDAAAITANNASSFGAQVFAGSLGGTTPIYGTLAQAAGALGYAASINFDVANGRTTLMGRTLNSAPAATVSDLAAANALLSNNYTYYGAYANAANKYTIFEDGKVSGPFLWADTYLDQIYLNRELQRAGFETILAYNSLPYNQDGYDAFYRAYADVADAALTSGIIRAGVTLSQSQAAQINNRAGRDVASVVSTRGWYLLIDDAANAAQARQNRTSPQATFFYCDGGSIQQISLNSIAVI
jgi:hypothetical protein